MSSPPRHCPRRRHLPSVSKYIDIDSLHRLCWREIDKRLLCDTNCIYSTSMLTGNSYGRGSQSHIVNNSYDYYTCMNYSRCGVDFLGGNLWYFLHVRGSNCHFFGFLLGRRCCIMVHHDVSHLNLEGQAWCDSVIQLSKRAQRSKKPSTWCSQPVGGVRTKAVMQDYFELETSPDESGVHHDVETEQLEAAPMPSSTRNNVGQWKYW